MQALQRSAAGGIAGDYDLPSQVYTVLDLVDAGSRFSVKGLQDHWSTVTAQIDAAFKVYGFNAEWLDAMGRLDVDISDAAERRASADEDLLPTGTALDDAVAQAKAWRKHARTVVAVTPGLTRTGHTPTGSSVAQLKASLKQLLPQVGRAATIRFGGGAAERARGQALITKLDKAAAAHRAALAKLRPEIRTLNLLKGLLYEELKRLATAARNVLSPAGAHAFAVTTHVRSHRRHRTQGGQAAPPPVAASGGATT
jgi:hypothetical protein